MVVRTKRVLLQVVIAMVISATLCAELPAAELVLLQPRELTQVGKSLGNATHLRPDDPAHFNRRGGVTLLIKSLSSLQPISPGDHLDINVFPDRPFRIVVDSREQDRFGGHRLTGHVEGEEEQTFVMVINEEDFILSLQALNSGQTFYVSGKTGTGQGEAVEVDDRKRPPRIR